ncbi:TadE/TadG family type IV pilus assembly protein [Qipengyuania nanhaisediminis]|uniref:TadE/TadG family type IV pilus assembly protein n=1 Tax=Qipengyuania nanhaisediminis TaxID=604088 RepID=UPI0038B3DA56
MPTIPFVRKLAARLRRDTSAVSTIEFGFMLPLFITMGMTGTELAYMATVNMQVSQVATSLADNASRLGQTDNSAVTPTVTEADIDSIMEGALRQGRSFGLGENGRIILSSLEYHNTTGRQYFHWQRCRGDLARSSAYGDEDQNNGLGSHRIYGVGSATNRITADEGSAVMVAEIVYDYEGIITGAIGRNVQFRQEAIFLIRDDRNLEPGVTGDDSQSLCDA